MDDITTLKAEEKEKLEAEFVYDTEPMTHQPRENRSVHRHHSKGNWSGGLVLIGLGAFLLMRNMGWQPFNITNWWAFFILMPAFSNFKQAIRSYRRHGRLTEAAKGNFVGGLMIATVASFFLFNLAWGTWWPLFIIVGGIGSLLGGWWR